MTPLTVQSLGSPWSQNAGEDSAALSETLRLRGRLRRQSEKKNVEPTTHQKNCRPRNGERLGAKSIRQAAWIGPSASEERAINHSNEVVPNHPFRSVRVDLSRSPFNRLALMRSADFVRAEKIGFVGRVRPEKTRDDSF